MQLNLQKLTNRNVGEKNLASVEMKFDWNLPIPHNVKSFLSRSSNKQQFIDLFDPKFLIDGIHVK